MSAPSVTVNTNKSVKRTREEPQIRIETDPDVPCPDRDQKTGQWLSSDSPHRPIYPDNVIKFRYRDNSVRCYDLHRLKQRLDEGLVPVDPVNPSIQLQTDIVNYIKNAQSFGRTVRPRFEQMSQEEQAEETAVNDEIEEAENNVIGAVRQLIHKEWIELPEDTDDAEVVRQHIEEREYQGLVHAVLTNIFILNPDIQQVLPPDLRGRRLLDLTTTHGALQIEPSLQFFSAGAELNSFIIPLANGLPPSQVLAELNLYLGQLSDLYEDSEIIDEQEEQEEENESNDEEAQQQNNDQSIDQQTEQSNNDDYEYAE